MDRRELLAMLAAAPLPAALAIPPGVAQKARQTAGAARSAGGYAPRFFTEEEWRTVRILADIVIPADAKSGSATDAGVPEFMDFVMNEWPERQTPMRGGLAWLDRECRERYAAPFADCSGEQQLAMVDAIAWPARVAPDLRPGARWFSSFRDLTAGGFYSSEMGVHDLGYRGNTFVAEWKGCPDDALKKLGVQD
jgi:hypothetical protein